MTQLTEDWKRKLLQYARSVIEGRYTGTAPDQANFPDWMKTNAAATFVTLKKAGQLRGCIGSLVAVTSLLSSVHENALHAAFDDYRFSPVTSAELGQLVLEISILSLPQKVSYQNPQELLKILRPGIDGVILRSGSARATFLPQVWEQLPRVEDFLGHLCRKAGLTASCWQTMHPELETYTVEAFSEEDLR